MHQANGAVVGENGEAGSGADASMTCRGNPTDITELHLRFENLQILLVSVAEGYGSDVVSPGLDWSLRVWIHPLPRLLVPSQ